MSVALVPAEIIAERIFIVRGHKVILDADLAALYEVPTKRLNEQGITIIMVTHELDIAQYTRRNVIMRDGLVVTDTKVENRLRAETELARLKEEQHAVQLSP